MVDVDVHVGDRARTPWSSSHAIAIAGSSYTQKPRRPRGHRVVQAAGRVERVQDRAVADGLGRDERGARHERARLVHVREDRVVAGPEPEPAPVALLAVPGPLRRLDVTRRRARARARRRSPTRHASRETFGRSSRPHASISAQVRAPGRAGAGAGVRGRRSRASGRQDETGACRSRRSEGGDRGGGPLDEQLALVVGDRRTAVRASPGRRRPSTWPVLEYRSSPASRAAARTRSVAWCSAAANGVRLAAVGHELDARPSTRALGRPRPTDRPRAPSRAPSGAARPGRALASTRSSSRRRRSVAWATAAPSALCDHVNPWTNPVVAHRLEHPARTRREPERQVPARRALARRRGCRAGRPSGRRRTIARCGRTRS